MVTIELIPQARFDAAKPAPKQAMTDSAEALRALTAQAHVLAAGAEAPAARLAALEQLRKRAITLWPDHARRYAGQPLPLTDDEALAWQTGIELWQALHPPYARVARESAGEPARAALASERALSCLGQLMREHVRVYRGVPPQSWQALHQIYRDAETHGLAELAVTDPSAPEGTSICATTYCSVLLYQAAHLYAASAEQADAVERWIVQWRRLASVRATPPEDVARSPLAVDLATPCGPRVGRELTPSASVRYLDTSRIAPLLRELAARLRAGEPAGELVGSDALPAHNLERLLTHLYIQWCAAGSGRLEQRHAAATRGQAALNLHAIHFQITGRAFRQPGLRYTREEEYDLATFGHITERTEQRLLTGRSAALEPWDLINESTSGLLAVSREPDLHARIGHGQLVALRTSSMTPPLVGCVQRLRVEADGSTTIGLRVLRSEVRGVAVRPVRPVEEKFERALLIEADQQRGSPSLLVLPRGRYAAGAALDLHTSRTERVRLVAVVERGVEHECATFSSDA